MNKSRFAVMVDAGYLLRKAVEIISAGRSSARGDLELTDPAGLIQLLVHHTRDVLGLDPADTELLRVYWYDGALRGGHTLQQRMIGKLPDVNFRAGVLTKGTQKGVDSLIITDLMEFSANRIIAYATVVTGDSDLAVGIQIAQQRGVRVAVFGIEDVPMGVSSGQSFEIIERADRIAILGGTELRPFMRYVPRAAVPAVAGPGTPARAKLGLRVLKVQVKERIERGVKEYISVSMPDKAVVDPSTKRIEASVDAALLRHVAATLSRVSLDNAEMVYARSCFKSQMGT